MAQNFTPSERTQILLVLALLGEGDKTGFELVRALEIRRDCAFLCREGMLYPILYRLCELGQISAYDRETEAGTRRCYRLTRLGAHVLGRKKDEWKRLSRAFGGAVGGEACAKNTDGTMA
ncbi:MAG: PadR family transcriptional regulator [Butyricicoccus sp.]